MSSFTGKLQLKRPDGTDPFLRQDFIDNWNKIDAAPGLHICTSSGRPAWGSGQSGRLIFETDTERVMQWNGTAFVEPAFGPKAYSGALIFSGVTQGEGSTVRRDIGTLTVSRPTLITGAMNVRWSLPSNNYQSFSAYAAINGVNLGPTVAQVQVGGLTAGLATQVLTNTILFRGSLAAAGTYTIGFNGTTGSPSGSTTITLVSAGFVAIGTQ